MSQAMVIDPQTQQKLINQAAELLPDAKTYPGIFFPQKAIEVDTEWGELRVVFTIVRNHVEDTAHWEFKHIIPGTAKKEEAPKKKRRTRKAPPADPPAEEADE